MAQVGSTLIDIEVDESVAVSTKSKEKKTLIKVNTREKTQVSRPSENTTEPIPTDPLLQTSFSTSIKTVANSEKVCIYFLLDILLLLFNIYLGAYSTICKKTGKRTQHRLELCISIRTCRAHPKGRYS
jgi:hypothetical protein